MTCVNEGNLGANVIEQSVRDYAWSREGGEGACIHQIKELERSTTTTSEELVRDTR